MAFVALIYSFLLYYKERSLKNLPVKWINILAVIRFAVVIILLFFILKPLIKNYSTKIERPIIAFLQDNSQSLLLGKDSLYLKEEYLTKLKKEFKFDNADVVYYSFDSDISKIDSFNFNGNATNIESALNEISLLYHNRNIGAVVLASDGIYNEGNNPKYSRYKLNSPIYSLFIGDSLQQSDVLIDGVRYNKEAFIGNTFPVKVNLKAKLLEGKSVKVDIIRN